MPWCSSLQLAHSSSSSSFQPARPFLLLASKSHPCDNTIDSATPSSVVVVVVVSSHKAPPTSFSCFNSKSLLSSEYHGRPHQFSLICRRVWFVSMVFNAHGQICSRKKCARRIGETSSDLREDERSSCHLVWIICGRVCFSMFILAHNSQD